MSYDHLTSNPFYSTTHEAKVEALKALEGDVVDIHRVLDDISDGAGGCERAAFSTPDGNIAWISCMGARHGRRTYAYIEVVPADDGMVRVVRTTYCGLEPHSRQSEDSPSMYAMVVEFIFEVIEEE